MFSLSEKSATVSLGEDGASTRALAGSILQYRMEKTDNTSVNSYKTGQFSTVSTVIEKEQYGTAVHCELYRIEKMINKSFI